MVRLATFVRAVLLLAVGALCGPPHGCLKTPPPPDCQAVLHSVGNASAEDKALWVSDINTDPFYQSPKNLSSYKPGSLIRLDRIKDSLSEKYTLPPGLTLYRMLFLSTDMDRKPVPASAFVLLPYSRPPREKQEHLQVIAWAHGTSGIERHCAPSNQHDLYYQYEAPFSMALQGFAVIATDYAGEGTDTTFNYLAGPSHAADIAYSVMAAREALPHVLSEEWVVVGHSEGGLTAWATNEREVEEPSKGFLGAVSIGPALANLRIIRTNLQKTNGSLGDTMPYPAYTLEAIARLDKSVNVNDYFSEVGLERAKLASKGCFDTAVAAFSNLTFSEVYKNQAWLNASFAESWQNRTGVSGVKKLAKPMLLIVGLDDHAVPFTIIEEAFTTQCHMHQDAKVRLSKYPEMDHDEVAYVSQLEYFDWIRNLFDGRGPKKCETSTIGLVIPKPESGDDEEVDEEYQIKRVMPTFLWYTLLCTFLPLGALLAISQILKHISEGFKEERIIMHS